MPEGDESMKPVTQFTTIIPHFWYDIIGQIVPGSYLIVGLHWLGFRSTTIGAFVQKYLTTILPNNSGEIRFFPVLVVFAFSSYFVGGAIGPFSHWLVQVPFRRMWPLAVPAHTITLLEPIFGTTKATDIERIRRQCTWITWKCAPELAIIFSRWDAMAFAARSIALSSMCLLLFAIYADCVNPQRLPLSVYGILLLLTIGFSNAFKHFRDNAFKARCEMVAVALYKSKV